MKKVVKKILTLVAVCGISTGCMGKKDAPKKQELTLKEAIPLGLSRNDAERVLAEQGFEHGWYPDERVIRAVHRLVNGTNSLVRESVSVVIFFDEGERVKELNTKRVFTGL